MYNINSVMRSDVLFVGWNLTAFIVAVLGAVVLLAVLNVLFGRRGT